MHNIAKYEEKKYDLYIFTQFSSMFLVFPYHNNNNSENKYYSLKCNKKIFISELMDVISRIIPQISLNKLLFEILIDCIT